jgi:hypothetical protein
MYTNACSRASTGVELDALDERQAAGDARRACGATHDLAAARSQLGQILVEVAELEQRHGMLRALDAFLELVDRQAAVEVVGTEQIGDRGAVAVARAHRRVRHSERLPPGARARTARGALGPRRPVVMAYPRAVQNFRKGFVGHRPTRLSWPVGRNIVPGSFIRQWPREGVVS